ncbi:hypothetical protein M422DRAFT_23924 [Sphaerobolus stellatus SS14]|nr:hypothetical protein M422DRAFT_23924 [Sphaerobolus stellatus SS14]
MATPTTTRPPIAPPSVSVHPTLQPTKDQVIVIYVVLVYVTLVFAVWSVPIIRLVITPIKLFTIGWHELCHALAGIFTGGSVLRITIDPNLGGATLVTGGHKPTILCAGYIGSSLLGGVFILAGYDTLVAKICSFFIGVGLISPLGLVRDKLTILSIFIYEAILIGFWFADHASALRWYCLFIGVINSLYAIWDVTDEKFFKKRNDADTTQFALLFPRISSHVWALVWISFQIAVLIAFLFIGIAAFRKTPDELRAEADKFLPT